MGIILKDMVGSITRQQVYHPKITIPMVKHGGGTLQLGLGQVKTEGIIDSNKYQSILAHASFRELKIKKKFTFQHDNNTNHKFRSTKKRLQMKNIKVLEWRSQSLDLNHIKKKIFKNLSNDLKRVVHRRSPYNLIDL